MPRYGCDEVKFGAERGQFRYLGDVANRFVRRPFEGSPVIVALFKRGYGLAESRPRTAKAFASARHPIEPAFVSSADLRDGFGGLLLLGQRILFYFMGTSELRLRLRRKPVTQAVKARRARQAR
jgi:hypothetical protein